MIKKSIEKRNKCIIAQSIIDKNILNHYIKKDSVSGLYIAKSLASYNWLKNLGLKFIWSGNSLFAFCINNKKGEI